MPSGSGVNEGAAPAHRAENKKDSPTDSRNTGILIVFSPDTWFLRSKKALAKPMWRRRDACTTLNRCGVFQEAQKIRKPLL